MRKLEELIAQKAYELDSLMLLRQILSSGDCNTCACKNDCTEVPKAGQMVRYNCYAYVEEQTGENT